MNKHSILVLIFALAGVVLSGVLFDSSPGFGPENLLGLLAGGLVGVLVARLVPAASEASEEH